MVWGFFCVKKFFYGGLNGIFTKRTCDTKCYARNFNHQNLYNPASGIPVKGFLLEKVNRLCQDSSCQSSDCSHKNCPQHQTLWDPVVSDP